MRVAVEYKEKTIEDFIKYSKQFISNPASLILDYKNNPKVVGVLMSLIFEERPTLNQLITRTPKLSCIFRLQKEFLTMHDISAGFVGDEYIFWNQVAKEVQYLNHILQSEKHSNTNQNHPIAEVALPVN